ncbi:NAD(P)/FAD-dependent oxidoreductase [Glycomyces terrestris]|uniref:NAD(P)/FAD-dependent oxidoreductase n=1 Tax=Glycomyces terrestris TaxID=2493553 RepID=A0A426V3J0_9ACTN|nr:FAD-dependent oxidoreductase [Glycomyces terrestris]RRS01426.1 NAD(P)/FAD-dependent oxidoreductase [Glycomyces terrestris]
MSGSTRVVVVGGGFAGLETAFTVREHLGDGVDLALVVNGPDFLDRPNNLYVPFRRDPRLRVPLAEPAARRDITLHQSPLGATDCAANRIELADGSSIRYDYLVLATGAAMRPGEIPGLAEHAHTVWTEDHARTLGAALDRLAESARAGRSQRALFLVPPGNMCSAPLYDLVLLLEQWLRSEQVRDRVDLLLTTWEDRYLEAFGPDLHGSVRSEFATRGIEGVTAVEVDTVHPDRVAFTDGTSQQYDLLITFPPHVAACAFDGLPTDARGFLKTDPATSRVMGTENVFAPGDSGDFPVKLAYLALRQADAAADEIAWRIDPNARRARRELDFQVGASPLWNPGRVSVRVYMPRLFAAGRPSQSGIGGW